MKRFDPNHPLRGVSCSAQPEPPVRWPQRPRCWPRAQRHLLPKPLRRNRSSSKAVATRSPRTCCVTTRPRRSDQSIRFSYRNPAERSSHVAHPQVRSSRHVAVEPGLQPVARCLARHSHARPAFVPAPLGPRPGCRHGGVATGAGAQGQSGRCQQARRRRQRQGGSQAHGVRPLLGGLRDRCRGRERRLGAPGAGVRQPDQPRRALRQGRCRARERPWRVPPEVPDEAGRRQVPAHQLGRGAQRGQRQDARVAQGQRCRLDLRGRLVEAQQRAVVPAAQVDDALGQQQHRPPGAHLPQHHGGRRGQHLGLRRDDQLVQRHAELEGCVVHRQQCGRGAPGVDAAHAACQGNRLQDDRGRPALHAHRGQGRPVRAHPLGHRHRVPVRRAAPRVQERLGRQEVHRGPRLRHGQGARRRDVEVDTRQGARGLRRRRGHRAPGGQDDGRKPSQHHRLVHGPDAAHHRQRDGARLVHPAIGAGQHRRVGRRRQHLPRPRQRAGRHRHRPQSRLAARLLRPGRRRVQALRHGVGRRLRLDQEAIRARHDEQAGHDGVALDRRRAREERADRPGQQPARHVLLGSCAQLAVARTRDEARDGQARSAGGDRSVPERHRRDGRDAQQGRRAQSPIVRSICCRRARSSRPAVRSPRRTVRCSGARR